ncbi:MAG: phosphoenolpyruvate--protein phosphotransferase, partial [Clostridia bacterium]|nr:phosphoenolpyruvate--protein phosphotransferase [Clostridia bacterium]
MVALQGTGVSPGIASGKLFYYKRDISDIPSYTVSDTENELNRWQKAVKKAYDELDGLAQTAHEEAGYEAAMLFETHQLMLEDLDFADRITDLILNRKRNAEAAITIAADEFSQMFAAMDDEYMKARSVDVVDISKRLVSILTNSGPQSVSTTEPVIIAADDLTPSETVQLDKNMILGFILSGGNANSHTAILARTLGIPAIINTDGELKPEYEGRKVIMDGSVGYIVIDPDDATKEYMEKKRKEERAVRDMLNRLKGKSDVTLDGKNIRVYANITHPTDIDAVIANDAKGIGLFRSEFLYLGADDFPDEETQFEAYKSVVEKMAGSPVIIRTMDIGADKKVDYFEMAKEENPALGIRAIRICLTRPGIFKTQLRALYRASAFGRISIMFPMITSVEEVQKIKEICNEVQNELKEENIPYNDKTP